MEDTNTPDISVIDAFPNLAQTAEIINVTPNSLQNRLIRLAGRLKHVGTEVRFPPAVGVRSAPVSGRPRDFVSAGAVRRRLRPDRQLPARAVALLRQFAGFLRAAGRAGLHPLLSRVLLHRARRAHLHPAPRRAARPAAFHRIVPALALP